MCVALVLDAVRAADVMTGHLQRAAALYSASICDAWSRCSGDGNEGDGVVWE